jgi:hypothetical protein
MTDAYTCTRSRTQRMGMQLIWNVQLCDERFIAHLCMDLMRGASDTLEVQHGAAGAHLLPAMPHVNMAMLERLQ